MKTKSFLLIILLLILLAYIVLLKNKSSNQIPTSPPNWTNKNITYTILKNDNNYEIEYVLDGQEGIYYVGNSNVNLEKYINKKVLIHGDFPLTTFDNESNIQCINNICHPIFQPRFWEEKNQYTQVINISAITYAK